jgi:hypothetical protein
MAKKAKKPKLTVEQLRQKYCLFSQLGAIGVILGDFYDAMHPGRRERIWRQREKQS